MLTESERWLILYIINTVGLQYMATSPEDIAVLRQLGEQGDVRILTDNGVYVLATSP